MRIPKGHKKYSWVDYDFEYDILYLKLDDRKDYNISTELDNIVVDFDKNKSIIGIQIMDASEFLGLSKESISAIKKWLVKISLQDGKLDLRIEFEVKQGNKTFIKNPIIIESLCDKVPDAEMVCAVG